MRTGIAFVRTACHSALLLFLALSLLAACGASPSASVTAHSTATASNTPAPPASSPPGGPAPAQLLGVWVLPHTAPNPIDDFTLTLHANTFTFNITRSDTSSGDIVVSGNEIDFFNGEDCGLSLPDGVGRYQWTLAGGVLRFMPLGQDPCGERAGHLSGSYTKQSG